jgi:hypothetical protein
MRVTKSHLKKLINRAVLEESVRSLMLERMSVATVSDITRFRPQIEEYSEILVDELQTHAERMEGIDEKRRQAIIGALVDAVAQSLIGSTSGMTSDSLARAQREKDEKQYQAMRNKKMYGSLR